jgi:hypothetical protein
MRSAARKAIRQSLNSDVSRTRSIPNTRDTKQWCKGKIGVEHKLAVKTYLDLKNWTSPGFEGWLVRYCATCGKELATYAPPWRTMVPLPQMSRRYQPKPMPEWASEFFDAHPEIKRRR